MATGYYGLDYPNRRAGGAKRDPASIQIGVIHVTVNAPSTKSANQVAQWQSTQDYTYSGYHSLFDSDEHLKYFPDNRISNGVVGYNSKTVNLSAACKPDSWVRYENWAALTYGFMAKEVRRLWKDRGLVLRVITKSEADRGLKGWTSHHRLDPARRTDPGALVDGFGAFSFEHLFTLAADNEPAPTPTPAPAPAPAPIIEETDTMKHGDSGVEVRQLQHLINAVIVHTSGWTEGGPDLLPITGKYDNALAERVQHAIWRMEGWVYGHPIYAEEEGGSRVTGYTVGYMIDCARGLRSGTYDTDPHTSITQSGVDLKDAEAVAKWVRENNAA